MPRVLSLAASFAFLACLALHAAEPPADGGVLESPATRQAKPQVKLGAAQDLTHRFRDARIVRDLATLDLSKLSSQNDGANNAEKHGAKEGAWIVAEIRPGGLSGALHNQGSYIEAETGRIVDSGIRPKAVILVGGQWKRLVLLTGTAPAEGRYAWKEPERNYFDRSLNIYDLYSVFTGPKNDGVVICQFFADRKGAAQFGSLTSIPREWVPFVKPAMQLHAPPATELASDDLDKLYELASGDNPFVALTAVRRILAKTTSEEDFERLAGLRDSLHGYRRAVLDAQRTQSRRGRREGWGGVSVLGDGK